MTVLEQIRKMIAKVLDREAGDFIYPPQADLGDLSLPCFILAKELERNPVLVAKDLADQYSQHPELKQVIKEIRAEGAYLNFYLKEEYLAASLIKDISRQGAKFGQSHIGGKQTVMIEYSNGNTHKEYHVGHLRNICYGESASRLLSSSGYRVVPVSYINDFGIHVAKTLWFWEDYLRRIGDSAKGLDKGYLLGKCYSAASQKISEYEKAKSEVAEVMKVIEGRQGKMYKLWQTSRRWSLVYFAKIYKELGIVFQETFYESEVIGQGLKIVESLLAKGILVKSQGAIVADLQAYDLGVLPIIRSDGTALYPVADLALALIKAKKYKLAESIYVVDLRQSLYFKQLFKILELMGDKNKRSHLVYDFVTLPGGMMASRTGNVITYQELKQEAWEKNKMEIKSRHSDWNQKKIDQLALKLALGTIKFEMLKVSADKIITFDINEALRLNGYTAVYLQYSLVRIKSLIRKSGRKRLTCPADLEGLILEKEKNLLMTMAKYPEIREIAAAKRDPSEIAHYLFSLAQMVNDYYQSVNVLQAESREKTWRLSLLQALGQILSNGLELLGIETLEEM
ncbi:MAG: arginine--tRNA ligase [Patescibacteria group bacterium]